MVCTSIDSLIYFMSPCHTNFRMRTYFHSVFFHLLSCISLANFICILWHHCFCIDNFSLQWELQFSNVGQSVSQFTVADRSRRFCVDITRDNLPSDNEIVHIVMYTDSRVSRSGFWVEYWGMYAWTLDFVKTSTYFVMCYPTCTAIHRFTKNVQTMILPCTILIKYPYLVTVRCIFMLQYWHYFNKLSPVLLS